MIDVRNKKCIHDNYNKTQSYSKYTKNIIDIHDDSETENESNNISNNYKMQNESKINNNTTGIKRIHANNGTIGLIQKKQAI